MWITGVVTVLSALAGGPEPWDLARLAMSRHQAPAPEARIWFDRGVDPVLERGDRVRVFYRSSVNAYVAILQVDTDGTVRLLYPRSPSENHYTRANQDYRLLFPRSPYWYVGDRPGMGYFLSLHPPGRSISQISATPCTAVGGTCLSSETGFMKIPIGPWTTTWRASCPTGSPPPTGSISSPTA